MLRYGHIVRNDTLRTQKYVHVILISDVVTYADTIGDTQKCHTTYISFCRENLEMELIHSPVLNETMSWRHSDDVMYRNQYLDYFKNI